MGRDEHGRSDEKGGLRKKECCVNETTICLIWKWKVELTVITKGP